MNSIELLAPAGSKLSLIAAVQSGADAVYIGGSKFSARQSAENFDIDQMRDWVDYCHLYGVKVYVAVNTLIKENEISELVKYAYSLNDIGVDAIIIQDMGAINILKNIVPQLPLHASTQMTVHNLKGVKYLENMGFERVVLSRELTDENIGYICRNSNAEIEVFVHGALCICYSGQCLMSSMIGGRSGNRGRCAQPCRLEYDLIEDSNVVKRGHILSTKDLALVDELGRLNDMGVKSIKIEGRLKRAEYVATVVGIYRKYLDTKKAVTQEDRKELKEAFNRSGLTKAYFAGETGAKMMSILTPGNVGENVFSDEIKKRCREDTNLRLINVKIKASLKLNEVLKITMTDCDGNSVCVSGTIIAEPAKTRSIDETRLKEQLSKLGASAFFADEVMVDLGDGISIPISEINNVRRNATQELTKLRLNMKNRNSKPFSEAESIKRDKTEIELTAEVYTLEQANAVIDGGIKRVYAPFNVVRQLKKVDGIQIITKLPEIMHDDFIMNDIETEGVLINAPWQYIEGKNNYADFRFNIFNSYSANAYANCESITLSPELNLKEIRQILDKTNANIEIIGYGHLPLMITQNSPIKVSGKCKQKDKHKFYLKDRKQEKFPVICARDSGCVSKILNSKPIFMADKLNDLKKLKINSIRLIFTVENYGKCDRIINMYRCALSGVDTDMEMIDNSFTRGHFYRGVE